MDRSQTTVVVWNRHLASETVGSHGVESLEELVSQFPLLAQACTDAEFEYNHASRDVKDVLLRMKELGTKVPALIQALLEENEVMMRDVDLLFQTKAKLEAGILKRARELYPVWLRANAALAAQIPPQPEILRTVQGVPHSAAMLKGLIDGYADLIKALEDKSSLLEGAKKAQRDNDRAADRLNKRFYKMAKAISIPDSALYDALKDIPTEPSTPKPKPVEIATVSQGGDGGMQVLVAFEPGGGKHATTLQVQWMVEGVDEDFAHAAPLAEEGRLASGPARLRDR